MLCLTAAVGWTSASADFVRGLAGHEVAPKLAEALFQETGGNPLFLEEVIRHVMETGGFSSPDGVEIESLDALDLPKRDIYVGDGYQWLDLSVHPWYQDAERLALPESCAIKSHELPGSPLAKFDAVFLHLVRDGRDLGLEGVGQLADAVGDLGHAPRMHRRRASVLYRSDTAAPAPGHAGPGCPRPTSGPAWPSARSGCRR